MRRLTIGLAFVCVGVFALAGVATAHKVFYGGSIRQVDLKQGVNGDGNATATITGRVASGKAPCKRGRIVQLVSGDGKRIASTRADGRGRFGFVDLLTAKVPEDIYSVRAPRKRLAPKTRRHRHFCRPAKAVVGKFGEGKTRPDRGHGHGPGKGRGH